MGHLIDIFDFGPYRVCIKSNARDKYLIGRTDQGSRCAYLMMSPAGNYFFDNPAWTNSTAQPVRFSSYDAAVIFVSMFDTDKLVDLSHSDASIRE